ncbi:MAG: BatD family protein, partial [Limisphaerales bacterium]
MTRIKSNTFLAAVILFLAFGFAVAGARGANFTASLDRDTIALGETATLSLTFEGGQPKNIPVPNVPGLYFGRPSTTTSQNIDFNSGQISSTISITYPVSAQREGTFVIPSITANIDGRQIISPRLTLTVTQPSAASTAAINSGSQIAFMKLVLPKKEMYEGEVVGADLEIWLRDDIENFGNFQLAAAPADGFNIGKMTQGSRSREQIGNHTYTVIPLSFTLTAIKTGALNVGPVTASAV